ncbi:leucine-rich repeat transmembrane neuronal protein 3-like [Centruroides sculpturatus]|uniref:leucine-rich repeat transmembrane neuronal protein 3-like n=1 Tax=Centruroides sculpturatus TaxID=218467 RepID=UPI000C6D1756|nr:leucine-rich repeat transmembrane neuronal protein 3-like [Centruroides sculpturatus]XP_023234833.1 leucine-rich repeat transmembrane neuronal protein 3-like [Centruroides sculpturatus]
MTGFLFIFGLLLAFHLCVGDDDELCPPSSVIAPCDCDGEGINCMKAKDDAELQKVFRSIPKPWAFRGVWIQITDMSQVPSYMFKGIEVQAFHLEVNRINKVSPNAFNGSELSVRSISLFGNVLTTVPFEDFKKLQFLATINIARNNLDEIPQDAFRGMQRLTSIILAENRIRFVGMNAFNDCPNLQQIDLLHNRINILGPMSFAMTKHNPFLQINLANCSIASISPTAFTGAAPKLLHLAMNRLPYLEEAVFGPILQKTNNVAGVIDVSLNPFMCQGCNYLWLVINKNVLKYRLPGFRCMNGMNIDQLTRQNIWCN